MPLMSTAATCPTTPNPNPPVSNGEFHAKCAAHAPTRPSRAIPYLDSRPRSRRTTAYPTPAPARAVNMVWLHGPATNPRATNTLITGPVRSPNPAEATSFAAYSPFSPTGNPRPAIAPYTNPSTTLLICDRP